MSGSGDERAHKRSRQNVSQACVNCRQRKKKCDGNEPCATCLAYKDECVWGGKDDWRKPLSRSETNALRGRVEQLEALVRDYKTRLELVSIQRSMPSVESSTRSPMPQKLAPPRHRDDVEDVLHDDDGTLRFFGPTSAFHRAKPSHPPSREPFHTRGEDMKWARFLPDIYLTRDAHDTAVDRFFRYFSAFGQRVTPHLFYRDMELALDLAEADIPVAAPNYSPLLHNVILCLGLAYADEGYLRAVTTRRAFHEEANRRLDAEIGNPSLATVQGLALRSSFSSTEGDYSVGWINNGLATRMCYALGLHVDTTPLVERGKLLAEQNTQRCVTYWTCYVQEEMWAIYMGRTPLMSQWHSVPYPTVDTVTDNWEWTWPDSRAPPQKMYLSTCFVYTTALMRIATEITTTIYTGRYQKSDLVHDGTVKRFSDQLTAWLQSLPPPLQLSGNGTDLTLPHVVLLHLGCSWIAILLFQPFSQVANKEDVDFGKYAMTRCHRAALKVHRLAQLYRAQHKLKFVPPTIAQTVYTAGTSFLLAAAQAADKEHAAAALAHCNEMLAMLREISETWHAAAQKALILEELVAEYQNSTEAPVQAGQLWTVPLARDHPNPSPTTLDHPWSASDATLDDFIQSLFSQNTMPIGSDVDLMALLQDGMGLGLGTGQGSG
ncbi:hypothetical protein CcaverHIS002_0110390 [Cutaneotrichosporon cavernicola]|uniref:Zn(2)-C6 fungal-type domain-containing protein n=1 Tax=Cutaneotrichosporon cavernicola TaxID=279322 RepID=A0AA48L2A0_9TREE|nr:uncharacterized protein CcaverHIS019_0110310 [Cutaneotrichosporon cavernicola]BEI80510.1 hypothetical protein CcaverHIS002_0110390 [Cutaneotrichosporon cavernicola]BEI88313.1 hypothetical protein CcaverHIS019_0110310 [Cutaneotrichosporon cavernicola]BEI96085.1 hypothetical protein CcaverHIS631_0110340 [Cutaneotrichosporon cavernicola]BEJ03858.1 hypothetical protein CcaverHIS641_0110330 [Cutaneotrichosporon cavernicola]